MDKIMVQRANVILEISSEDKNRFMEQGYSVIDAKGKVIERALPNDVPSLRKLVKELSAENDALKAEIEKLNKPTRKPKAE